MIRSLPRVRLSLFISGEVMDEDLMPIYADIVGNEKLKELMKYNRCAECGAFLTISLNHERRCDMLVCERFPEHEGIVREASPYEQRGDESLNIPTRRKKMVEEHGADKVTALEKYMGRKELAKTEVTEILTTIYPKAPAKEMTRAVMLCASYGLNPLMGHVFLIPFKTKDGQTWATVLGIKAKRLLATRRGSVSYVDDTPRLMSEAEQTKIFGKVDPNYIFAITIVRDPKTSADGRGYGKWKRSDTPYGIDKGNSAENMAFIRSEAQALDRLRPGEMPMGIEVVDEEFVAKAEPVIEGDFKEVKEGAKPPAKKAAPAKAAPAPAKDEPLFPDEADLPKTTPSQMTLNELKDLAVEMGWKATDIGPFVNITWKWDIKEWKDLDTPERINKLAKHMSENPKTKK